MPSHNSNSYADCACLPSKRRLVTFFALSHWILML